MWFKRTWGDKAQTTLRIAEEEPNWSWNIEEIGADDGWRQKKDHGKEEGRQASAFSEC